MAGEADASDITYLSRGGQRPRLTEIIHLADLHVHSGDRRTARIDEYRQVFWRFLDEIRQRHAVRQGSAILVICGDVIHNKQKLTTDSTKMWFEWLNELLDLLPVLLICGNHDVTQIDLASTDFLEMVCTPYHASGSKKHPLHYLRESGVYAWEDVAFGVVSIKETLDHTRRSGRVEELPAFPAPPSSAAFRKRVALFHGIVSQWSGVARVLGLGDRDGGAAGGAPIPRYHPMEWFQGYDWLMLGDIHLREAGKGLDGTLTWAYPGSMVQQNFGEPVDGHGYLVWSIDDDSITARDISNDHAYISLVKNQRGHFCVAGQKQPVALLDRDSSGPPLPLLPRVRIFGGQAGDEAAVRALLAERGVRPCVVKSVRVVQKQVGGQQQAGGMDDSGEPGLPGSMLMDLNNPERWLQYLETIATCGKKSELSELILNPQSLLLNEAADIDQEILARVKAYNSTIQKALDAFHLELQSLTVAKHKPVRFLSMAWDYLMCYGKDNHIDFQGLDGRIALLNGKNATGKSSFFDVICIALFGEITSIRKELPGDTKSAMIIYSGKPNRSLAHVAMDLNVGDDCFRLYRSFEAKKASGYKQPISAWVRRLDASREAGECIADGTIHVDAWVNSNIGRLEDMLMSNMLCQNDTTNFFMKKKTEQKAILEKALHIETITAFGKIVEESAKAHKAVSAKLHDFLRGLAAQTSTATSTATSIPRTSVDTEDTGGDGGQGVLQGGVPLHTAEEMHDILSGIEAQIQTLEHGALDEASAQANALRAAACSVSAIAALLLSPDEGAAVSLDDARIRAGGIERNPAQLQVALSGRAAMQEREANLLSEAEELNLEVCQELDGPDAALASSAAELDGALQSARTELEKHCSAAPEQSTYTRSHIAMQREAHRQWIAAQAPEFLADPEPALRAERARAEDSLRQEKERLAQLHDSAPRTISGVMDIPAPEAMRDDAAAALAQGPVLEEAAAAHAHAVGILQQVAAAAPPVARPREDIEAVLADAQAWRIAQPRAWLKLSAASIQSLLTQKEAELKALQDNARRLAAASIAQPAAPRPAAKAKAEKKKRAAKAASVDVLSRDIELLRGQRVVPPRRKEDLAHWRERWQAWQRDSEGAALLQAAEVLRQEYSLLSDRIESIVTLQARIARCEEELVRAESEIDSMGKEPHNDECWACCQRPAFLRKQALSSERESLASGVESLRIRLELLCSGKDLEQQRQALAVLAKQVSERERFEARAPDMEAERRAWEQSERDWASEEDRLQRLQVLELSMLEARWSAWDKWSTDVAGNIQAMEACQAELETLRLFSKEAPSKAAAVEAAQDELAGCAAYEQWKGRHDAAAAKVESALRALAVSWTAEVAAVKLRVTGKEARAQSLAVFLDGTAFWKGELATLEDNDRLLDEEERWTARREELRCQLRRCSWRSKWQRHLVDRATLLQLEHHAAWQAVVWHKELADKEAECARIRGDVECLRERWILMREAQRRQSRAATVQCRYQAAIDHVDATKALVDELYALFVGHKRGAGIDAAAAASGASGGFRTHIYKTQVVPMMERKINELLQDMDGELGVGIEFDGDGLTYVVRHAGHSVPLSHGSGYQKFIVGLAMRASLARIGAVGQNIKHLFIDEGFVALDSDNILKVRDILETMMDMGGFRSVVLMSHLDCIREIADIKVDIARCSREECDRLVYSSCIAWGGSKPCSGLTKQPPSSQKKGKGMSDRGPGVEMS